MKLAADGPGYLCDLPPIGDPQGIFIERSDGRTRDEREHTN